MESVGVYEAKTNLPRLLDRVEAGESILITRHGRPIAVLGPPPRARCRDVREVIAALDRLRASIPPPRPGDPTIRAMIEEGRR